LGVSLHPLSPGHRPLATWRRTTVRIVEISGLPRP
jgi:hypothetical protein